MDGDGEDRPEEIKLFVENFNYHPNKTIVGEITPSYIFFEDCSKRIYETLGRDIKIVLHTDAQPSHDWAAKEPITDFNINANGTLNLLELSRKLEKLELFYY